MAHDVAQTRIGLGDIDAGGLVGVGLPIVVAHLRSSGTGKVKRLQPGDTISRVNVSFG
jgi:hypothetical protein